MAEEKQTTSPITSRLDEFINQPAIREAIENHYSNWIPDSKGGEPNHKTKE